MENVTTNVFALYWFKQNREDKAAAQAAAQAAEAEAACDTATAMKKSKKWNMPQKPDLRSCLDRNPT